MNKSDRVSDGVVDAGVIEESRNWVHDTTVEQVGNWLAQVEDQLCRYVRGSADGMVEELTRTGVSLTPSQAAALKSAVIKMGVTVAVALKSGHSRLWRDVPDVPQTRDPNLGYGVTFLKDPIADFRGVRRASTSGKPVIKRRDRFKGAAPVTTSPRASIPMVVVGFELPAGASSDHLMSLAEAEEAAVQLVDSLAWAGHTFGTKHWRRIVGATGRFDVPSNLKRGRRGGKRD